MLLIKGVGGGILESLPLGFDGAEIILDGWVFPEPGTVELMRDGYPVVESRLGNEVILDGYVVSELASGGVVSWQP